jgi:hypothetical protein
MPTFASEQRIFFPIQNVAHAFVAEGLRLDADEARSNDDPMQAFSANYDGSPASEHMLQQVTDAIASSDTSSGRHIRQMIRELIDVPGTSLSLFVERARNHSVHDSGGAAARAPAAGPYRRTPSTRARAVRMGVLQV